MKSFEILLNSKYTASTQTITSGLDLQNDYYVYVNKNGGGIVNPYNVRGYLNDSRNQQITNDFFAYLTGSTSADQALNILTADKKLSDTFNDYYQRVIISATQISSTAVIDQNLTGTTQIIANTYIHPWSGYAPDKQLTGITQSINNSIDAVQSSLFLQDFTTEESYYIPVYIERGTNQLSRYQYDVCDVFINAKTTYLYPQFSAITSNFFNSLPVLPAASNDTRIHTILDCFVDLNLETNENATASSTLLKASFVPNSLGNFAYFQIAEPSTLFNYITAVDVQVQLDKPSVLGIEEATINLVAIDALENIDFISSETFPITVSWAIGEQYKTLSFSAKTDYLLEETEMFSLQISNLLNANPGPILYAEISIADTTVLRQVSLQVGGIQTGFDGIGRGSTEEGNDFELLILLDGPATGGETVTISQVSTISTPNVTLGPATNPLLPSDYEANYYLTPSTILYNQTFPKTVVFAPGEAFKSFNVWIKENSSIDPIKIGYFEISNAILSVIDQSKKVAEITVLDNEGQYKYLHLNFGTIYSEFGDSNQPTLMRQIDPQPAGFGGGYQNLTISQYTHNLIEYGTTINFRDYNNSTYSTFNTHTEVFYDTSLVKAKITNIGEIQSIVNGLILNTGQATTIDLTSNNFIITATTNSNRNLTTNLYEYGKYKVEIINNYVGLIFPSISPSYKPLDFKLRTIGNTQSLDKTILLGNYAFSGMTNLPNNITEKYTLQSKYKNVNTGRPNTGTALSPVYVCPPVASFFTSVSYSEFYAVDKENISVLGIIFLNYNDSVGNIANNGAFGDYENNTLATYSSFDFITATSASSVSITCAKTGSKYNDLDYISLPYHLEP
jgi:hypothetical protein